MAFGAALYSLNPEQPRLAGNAGYQEKDPAYYPGGDACNPSVFGPFPGVKDPGDAVSCQQDAEQHRLDTNDLIQQRRAADAAEASVSLSFTQTRIAAWGFVFTVLTFIAATAAAVYAGIAAYAAKDAVGHAKSAADSAVIMVEEARRTTRAAKSAVKQAKTSNNLIAAGFAAENRPWITVGVALGYDLSFKDDKVTAHLSVIARNIGNSPAQKIHTALKVTTNPSKISIRRIIDGLVEENTRLGTQFDGVALLPGEPYSHVLGEAGDYKKDTVVMIFFIVAAFYEAPRFEGKRVTTSVFCTLMPENLDKSPITDKSAYTLHLTEGGHAT